MNVTEVTDLYRAYVQENDERWHEDWVPTAMKAAYNQFRALIQETIPHYFATRVQITVTGTTYDLSSGAVSILGASPTDTKMSRFLSLWKTSGGTLQSRLVQGTGAQDALSNDRTDFWIEGDTIYFTWQAPAGEYTVVYVPQSTVTWTNNGVGQTEYIDDFDEFHELIALYAVERYSIRDGARQNIASVRSDLEDRLMDYLVTTMGDAGRTITNERY